MYKKIIIPIIIALFMGFLLSGILWPPVNVDIDCLIDEIEQANITEVSNKYGNGVITMDWSLNDIYQQYWNKHPKSRWAVETAGRYYFRKCQK